jgi:cytochrome c-type biogenesis protein CcmH/NrfF
MIPLAHLDDWGFIWVFYVLPVVIVIVGTVTSARTANRRGRGDDEAKRR